MKLPHLFAVVLTVLTIGCAPKKEAPKPVEPPTYSSDTLRAALQAKDASILVGTVNQVDERSSVASVVNVDPTQFKEGDILSFIDLAQSPIADGKVTAIVPGGLHVQYNVLPDGRAPRQGDLALRFTR